jgi:hypothetical protein
MLMSLMISSVNWKRADKGTFNGHGDCKGKLSFADIRSMLRTVFSTLCSPGLSLIS